VIAKLADDADWRGYIIENADRIAQVRAQLDALQSGLLIGYGSLALLAIGVFAARILRNRLSRVRVDYDGGLTALGRRGLSVLELSRMNGVPHADVCSGRGRCGTCRVHVDSGAERLSPRNGIEDATLARVHASEGDRLACQARVLASGVSVTRVLPPFADASAARQPQEWIAEDTAPAGGSTS
jgi:adenylate cyclase